MYSKGNTDETEATEEASFNSLQTGKCIQSCKQTWQYLTSYSFNSLQTGKCIQSKMITQYADRLGISVSIPFKRESVFKAINDDKLYNAKIPCFNSLQTGKCIQSLFVFRMRGCRSGCVSIPFKRESVFKGGRVTKRLTLTECVGFNSLQTGKCIQRIISGYTFTDKGMFQFPSNGKVYSKFPNRPR